MMNEVAEQAREFLNSIFNGANLSLRATDGEAEIGFLFDIDGDDSSLLLNEGGELLEALQHLTNQAFGRSLPKGERIVCDVENFRATREAELRAMARHAAESVRSTGKHFNFGPMNSNERRVIHMALSVEEDIQTESVGEGAQRRLRVSLKVPSTR
jgi:spoIIIJ-associated protein